MLRIQTRQYLILLAILMSFVSNNDYRNRLYQTQFYILHTYIQLHVPYTIQAKVLSPINSSSSSSSGGNMKNATTASGQDIPLSNHTAATVNPMTTQSLSSLLPPHKNDQEKKNIIQHIRRKRAAPDVEVKMPFTYNTLHTTCDFDIEGNSHIAYAPNHCIWIWNNKYAHEGFFRVYKTYSVESFFFGQFSERLRRFEVDVHNFDYTEVL